jgi:diguanylate cyclase (GGDEF)-like protein
MGHQLVAAVLVLLLTYAQIIACSVAMGWESGVHLYLIAAGLVVFAVFTERQRTYRWAFVILAAGSFVACQVLFPAANATIQLSTATLSAIMSVSAVVTALLVYLLAALAHYKAGQSRSHAVASAARAQYLANTDMLTGLANRRPIMDKLHRESTRGIGGFSVAIADLDRFKELNDAYGHACGDQVLSVVGELLKERLRPGDTLGRWGGEEFIFVLPGTDLQTALGLMEDVRASIEAALIVCGDHSHRVTSSFGVADGGDDGAPHRVVKRADDALYDAKMAGRNAVHSRAKEVGRASLVPGDAGIATDRRARVRRLTDRKQGPTRP